MNKFKSIFIFTLFVSFFALSEKIQAQADPLSIEGLIQLKRVGAISMSEDGQSVIYQTSQFNLKDDKKTTNYFSVPVKGGASKALKSLGKMVGDKAVSPDGAMKIVVEDVKIDKVYGSDYYKDGAKSNVHIYDDLNYRHWDTWEDGAYSHIFIQPNVDRIEKGSKIDIMEGEPHDCPQKPFGGEEDYLWSPDSKRVLYVTKKNKGTEYTKSTNSDIYEYNIETKKTTNLTADNPGYDTQPAFSKDGVLAFCRMARDGYESDKNDIIVKLPVGDVNLTKGWDGTVYGFNWSNDGKKIYFNAPVNGTVQLFEIAVPTSKVKVKIQPRQITKGQFDVNGVVGHYKGTMVVSRRDMNHAPELYSVDLKSGKMNQITHANDDYYNSIAMGKIEPRMTKTTDGKEMLSWVIYPPGFDPSKKYPTILYCQGGPQGALSQFYSYRWNFQLMAANGYIIIAPNRRGMPGWGVEWNEQISKDYGGQNMKDYLSAIDDITNEPYVDKDRLGCIGASYGGYSVFYLAAIHNKRFKTFISHDGIFNWRSMYGTTEELFFLNWDLGGPYWDKSNAAAQRTYNEFNPINMVDKWDTPIMIIQGGLDFRVPIGQGLEAFQAAQVQGIKSRLLYFPEENHWVLNNQNSLMWQREFYRWLKETL